LRARLEGNQAVLEVTDTGDKTIDEDVLLSNIHKGVGLGGLKVKLTFPYIKGCHSSYSRRHYAESYIYHGLFGICGGSF